MVLERMVTLEPSPEALERAASLLSEGALVAFPTETVYGLGAAALDERAVARIFKAKGRPRFDPLICHAADVARAEALVARFPEPARRLAERFWPGPLTLVLPKRAKVPDLVTSGQPTVAVRVPAHPVALDLLEAFGGPIAAPSANLFGAVSPTCAAHVVEQLGDRVALVLDGGECPVGVESSIIGLFGEGPPRLLRPGGVPLEALEAVIGEVERPPPSAFPSASPGRLERHYAPRTPLVLTEEGSLAAGAGARPIPGGSLAAPTTRASQALRIGRLAFRSVADPSRYAAVEILSPEGSLEEAARRLFAALRRLDAAEIDVIEAEPVPEEGLGRAIMDRLRRAAASSASSLFEASRIDPGP